MAHKMTNCKIVEAIEPCTTCSQLQHSYSLVSTLAAEAERKSAMLTATPSGTGVAETLCIGLSLCTACCTCRCMQHLSMPLMMHWACSKHAVSCNKGYIYLTHRFKIDKHSCIISGCRIIAAEGIVLCTAQHAKIYRVQQRAH